MPTYISRAALQIKVCIRTYRLFFVSGTEDFYWRTRTPADVEEVHKLAEERQSERKATFETWLNSKIPREEPPAKSGPVEVKVDSAEMEREVKAEAAQEEPSETTN